MTSISIHIIANQRPHHDDRSTLQCFIRVLCPHLIRNVQSRRRIDSSSIIAHPVNSDLHTWERTLKCYAKNSTFIHWKSIWIFLITSNWDWFYHFSQFLFMKNLKNKMLAGLWLVGEVDNHVAIYGYKVAESFSAFPRRSCLNFAGEFQALQPVPLTTFKAADEPLASCMMVHFRVFVFCVTQALPVIFLCLYFCSEITSLLYEIICTTIFHRRRLSFITKYIA